jgi:N-acetylmuramoyl-L-alanine amidase
VSEVIYNRAITQSRIYGATVEAVCRKPFQFSCWNDNDPNRTKLLAVNGSDGQFQICLQIAKQVTNGEITHFTKGARHYFDKRIPTPSWASGHTPSAEIRNHVFFNDIV